MKSFLFLLFLGFTCAANLFSQTQPVLSAPMDSLVVNGADLIMRQEYATALNYFRGVSEQFPDSPEGYLFQAATLQTRAMDFRDFREDEQFDSLLAISKSLSERMIEENPNSAWGHYYLGTAIGMDSYDKMQRGDYFSGYFKGRSAISEIEKTLELDSSFFDCYSILGTYYYWKSRKTEFLNWIPLFTDERAKGIRSLHMAIQHGRYQRYAALSNLVWIYLDAQNFTEAETFARLGLQLYPRQRAFLHGLASALQGQNRYEEAQIAFETLLKEILTARPPNDYNEIGIRVNIVLMKRALRDTTQVREHLSVVFAKENGKFPNPLRKKLSPTMALARKFEAELLNGTFPGQK